MTEAMPFLQKVILLSYDPRPFGWGYFSKISCNPREKQYTKTIESDVLQGEIAMKKKLTALLLALALVYTFSLPVAAAQKTVEWEGVTYTVDTEAQTIHDGESVYEYQVELYRDGYTLEITYPNGAFWSASVTESDGTYGWNEEYDMKGTVYPTGDTLETVLHNAGVTYISSGKSGEKSVLLLLVLLGVGIFSAAYPYGAWYLERGWYYKDAEPSDAALVFNRVVGILLLAGALIWFLFL